MTGDGLKVETLTALYLSQPVMSLAATYVRHGHNRETLQTVCVALDACDGRLPKIRISLVHNMVLFGARYKHLRVHKPLLIDPRARTSAKCS